MADRDPTRSNAYAYNNTSVGFPAARSNGHFPHNGPRRGGQPGSRYPSPASAYGTHSYPIPSSAVGPGLRAGPGQHFTAGDVRPPPAKTAGKHPRDARVQEGATATHGRVDTSGDSSPRRGLWATSGGAGEVPGGSLPRAERPTHGRDDRYNGAGGDGRARAFSQQRATQKQQKSQPARASSPRTIHGSNSADSGSRSGGFQAGNNSHHGSATQRTTARTERASASSSTTAVTPLAWSSIEAVGNWKLGEPASVRRARGFEEVEGLSAFTGCPVRTCPMRNADGMGASWMARHLA